MANKIIRIVAMSISNICNAEPKVIKVLVFRLNAKIIDTNPETIANFRINMIKFGTKKSHAWIKFIGISIAWVTWRKWRKMYLKWKSKI